MQSVGINKNICVSLPINHSNNRITRSSSVLCERRQESNAVFTPQFCMSNKILRSSSNENRLQSTENNKRQSSLVWPIPYIKHFSGYKRINNYGRVVMKFFFKFYLNLKF